MTERASVIKLTVAGHLSTLIYLINTDKMRITGIAIILFSFFVAIEYATKKKMNREWLAAQKSSKKTTIAKTTRARVLRQIAHYKRQALQMREWIYILYYICAILLFALATATYGNMRRDAVFGYAAGYTDAKTGNPPRAETDLQKLVDCGKRMNGGKPMPPANGCENILTFKK